jgi:hypothetical protein
MLANAMFPFTPNMAPWVWPPVKKVACLGVLKLAFHLSSLHPNLAKLQEVLLKGLCQGSEGQKHHLAKNES